MEAWRRWPRARPLMAGFCAAAGIACITLTARQIPYWENSIALFQHAIEVTGPNPIAHGYLGDVWRRQVMYDAAASEYREGLAIAPHNVDLLVDLGVTLSISGHKDEAIAQLTEAVQLRPGDPVIRNVLGNILQSVGRIDEANAQFLEARKIKPDQ